jgi:hypothetical protein
MDDDEVRTRRIFVQSQIEGIFKRFESDTNKKIEKVGIYQRLDGDIGVLIILEDDDEDY